MKIGFANDHAAVALKNELMDYLASKGHECINYGTDTSDKVDYADYGVLVAEDIMRGKLDKGVLICGTGIGISFAANKVPGIRAAVCSEPVSAMLTAKHNNSQIICMGARIIGGETAMAIVDAFLETEFEGGRHTERIAKIHRIEEKYGAKWHD